MTYTETRFKKILERIINTRIVPLIKESIVNIMTPEYFTEYYKEEIVDGHSYMRPVFNLSSYDVIITCLIIDELNNVDFVKEMNLINKPIDKIEFLKWIQLYLCTHDILFHIYTKKDNDEPVILTFYGSIIIDYRKVTRIGYEFLL